MVKAHVISVSEGSSSESGGDDSVEDDSSSDLVTYSEDFGAVLALFDCLPRPRVGDCSARRLPAVLTAFLADFLLVDPGVGVDGKPKNADICLPRDENVALSRVGSPMGGLECSLIDLSIANLCSSLAANASMSL